MKTLMIAIGNFLFKFRNSVFPLYVMGLLLTFRPPVCGWHTGNSSGRWLVALAVLTALSGLVLRGLVIGLAYIKRGGLNRKVYAADLVTAGMFSVCRNPLYVGNMLVYTGAFLMFGNPTAAVIGIASFWFFYECIIAAEEHYLRGRFGASYVEYCRDVPRWVPKLSRLPAAFKDMRFDWRKVLFKDYPTIGTTIALLAAIHCWELLANHGMVGREREFTFLVAMIAIIPVLALGIRHFKKSPRFSGPRRTSKPSS